MRFVRDWPGSKARRLPKAPKAQPPSNPPSTPIVQDQKSLLDSVYVVSLSAVKTSTGHANLNIRLLDASGMPKKKAVRLELAMFKDVGLSDLAPILNGGFTNVMAGEALSDTGYPLIKVITDANGEFSCSLNSNLPLVYIAASSTFGSPAIDSEQTIQLALI